MIDPDDETPPGGYWPSVADLFITLFIISIVILALVVFFSLNRGLGPLFGEIRKPTNELRAVVGLARVRETQSPYQVVEAVRETSKAAITRIHKLQQSIESLEVEIEQFKKSITDPHFLETLRADLASLKNERDSLLRRIAELENQIANLNDRLGEPGLDKEAFEKLKRENEQLKQESPTFVIDERRKEFRFDSGSPMIKMDFSEALRESREDRTAPFPDFSAKIIEQPERFNTLEIIGHTDGVPLSTSGNLDQRLPEHLTGQAGELRELKAGSNNDLGLLRALALRQEWFNYVESYVPVEHRDVLRRIQIRCYSAGQTILPVRIDKPNPADFRKNDPRARRIEMRLTRLSKATRDDE